MAMDPENVSTTALDLVNQLRGQNFSPELAEQAVQSKEYGQIPATYKPQQPGVSPSGAPFQEPPSAFGTTFWDKLYRNLEGSGEAMRAGAKGMMGRPGETPLAPLQALLGVLGGAFAIPGAATEHFIAEPIAQRGEKYIGSKPAAFVGGIAEQLPYLGMGGLGRGAAKGAAGAKIPRTMPGKRTGTDWDSRTGKGSFVGETMERRSPSRLTDAEYQAERVQGQQATSKTPKTIVMQRGPEGVWASPQAEFSRILQEAPMRPSGLPRELETLQAMQKTPQASQTLRDPISHRQTDLDPGFFGPLIENYYKTLMREGIGPRSGGGVAPEAPRVSELTRPWPGVYKGGEARGRTQPKSYKSPKTYDLSEYE